MRLQPAMARAASQLLAAARSIDPRFRFTSTVRSRAQQAAIWHAWLRRGRTGLPAAPPGRSLHEKGLAVDLARGIDPFRDPALAELGAWWARNGLGWSPTDPVHFQLPAIEAPRHALALGASVTPDPPEETTARAAVRMATLTASPGTIMPRLPTDDVPRIAARLIERGTDTYIRGALPEAAPLLGLADAALAALPVPRIAQDFIKNPVAAQVQVLGAALSPVVDTFSDLFAASSSRPATPEEAAQIRVGLATGARNRRETYSDSN